MKSLFSISLRDKTPLGKVADTKVENNIEAIKFQNRIRTLINLILKFLIFNFEICFYSVDIICIVLKYNLIKPHAALKKSSTLFLKKYICEISTT